MSVLRLAAPGDLDRLLPLVAACHAAAGIEQDGDTRRRALVPLLEGAPNGALWLIGPRSAPVGFIAVSFGWSIAAGGLDATIDEMFVRERVRGRGMGGEALAALAGMLAAQGVRALNLDVAQAPSPAGRLAARLGFLSRERDRRLTRML